MSRARRYQARDRALASFTRFFAAAALINAALGECLRIYPMTRLISMGSADLLLDISRGLEQFNASLAQTAAESNIRGRDLDMAFVRCEQRWVQRRLAARGTQDAQNLELNCRQLDGLLELLLRWPQWLCAPGSAALLARATQIARRSQDRPLQFSRQEDREQIGYGLIRILAD
jgi:hypothetical protein